MALTMKPLCVFFSLLSLTLYLSSSQASAVSPVSYASAAMGAQTIPHRKLVVDPSRPAASTRALLGGWKTQGDGRRMEMTYPTKEILGGEAEKNGEEGLIDNADYQGVVTHPSPLPTHPQP